jgi:hypothetical protein
MTDAYLGQVLAEYAVDTGPYSSARQVQAQIAPIVKRWGGQFLMHIEPSGSFAKGTAVRTGTDIDLFISLSSDTPDTLAQIYSSLFMALTQAGYQPKRQNVSLNIRVGAYDVDMVPAKRHSQYGGDHSLYSNRSDSWLQTNVGKQIAQVRGSGRVDEIRLLKIWRNRRGLDFPSFYLELAIIRALSGARRGNLASNIVTALEFLRDQLVNARIIDPANTNNVISDTLDAAGKRLVSAAARAALQSNWGNEFA